MKKLSGPLKVLMGGCIVLVVAALVVLLVVALRDRRPKGATVGAVPEATPKPAPRQESAPPAVTPRHATTRSRDQKLSGPEIRHMPRGVGITTSPPAQAGMPPVGSSPDAPRRFSNSKLPIQKAVSGMKLSVEQKVEIEKFEQEFKPKAAKRMKESDEAMRAAGTAVREAKDANDRVMMDDAREKLRLAVQKKLETLRDLSREYVEGIRPALTPEQIAEAEELLKQPQVYGASVAVPLQGTGTVDPESPERVIHKVIPLRKLPDRHQQPPDQEKPDAE
ncbi:MAG: hypothetical protein GWP05_02800 [Anaerolineaceae bacterium]|nr:hypothetical protein [Anaerolineaceae bacterium]